jgi:hypothetical protein
MKPVFVVLTAFLMIGTANAQWAVYDHEVKEILVKINRVTNIADKKVTVLELNRQAALSAPFETTAPTDALKYIGTTADCGDQTLDLNHYNACLGLRNLHLKTLEQTEAIIAKLETRRTEIKNLIEVSRSQSPNSDAAQLQGDQFELQILMKSYKQREQVHALQMVEAKRANDTGFDAPTPSSTRI